ncbi:hypothetical protein [Alkalicoccus urumqiensis]|uniref:Histidine phosphatase family protein n=1 Tax=Alkalicoccus urumqiensis TaxID=1548213 RepID=A0A2P6MEV6_ALKUR|nr:hypothetical protein [Alkalicoccus urumqiensis]PRO64818.1 hypothetical protein C6I21_12980 [Alkalicoccus urumqiensis]
MTELILLSSGTVEKSETGEEPMLTETVKRRLETGVENLDPNTYIYAFPCRSAVETTYYTASETLSKWMPLSSLAHLPAYAGSVKDILQSIRNRRKLFVYPLTADELQKELADTFYNRIFPEEADEKVMIVGPSFHLALLGETFSGRPADQLFQELEVNAYVTVSEEAVRHSGECRTGRF